MNKKYILKSSKKGAKLARILAKAIDLFITLVITIAAYPRGFILGIIYLVICDYIQEGQSIGKRVVGLRVISLKNAKSCSLRQSVVRNLPFIIPIFFMIIPYWGWIFSFLLCVPLILLELYLIFRLDSGHRLGDVMADTTVNADSLNYIDLNKKKDFWFNKKKV